MNSKNTFFGILDGNSFYKLPIEEQHRIVIDKKIFVGTSADHKIELLQTYQSYDDLPYLREVINFKAKKYSLNPAVIDEIYEMDKERYESEFSSWQEKWVTTYEARLSIKSKENAREYIDTQRKEAEDEYSELIGCNSFLLSLHNGSDKVDNVLKKQYSASRIKSYLYGRNETAMQFHIYNNWRLLTVRLSHLTPVEDMREGISLAEFICALHILGFDDLKAIKLLGSNEKKYKIMAYLFGKDYNSQNTLDYIRKNYNVIVNGSASERHTAFKNRSKVNKVLNNIKNT